jgi:hypothetical protein
MYDLLGKIIVVKVFSHQLNKNITPKDTTAPPSLNLFTVSANQHADNAATHAKHIIGTPPDYYDTLYYPAFSPRWSFTHKGCTTNKGATKLFQALPDDELDLRLQHRVKQGLFFRLRKFIGLDDTQIGHESNLRHIIRFTATCWTRTMYRNPSLPNLI